MVVIFVDDWVYHDRLFVHRQNGVGGHCDPVICRVALVSRTAFNDGQQKIQGQE